MLLLSEPDRAFYFDACRLAADAGVLWEIRNSVLEELVLGMPIRNAIVLAFDEWDVPTDALGI